MIGLGEVRDLLTRVAVIGALLLVPNTLRAQTPVEPVRPIGSDEVENTFGGSATATGQAQLTFERQFRLGPFIVRPGAGVGTGLETFVRSRTQTDSGTNFQLGSRSFLDGGPSLDLLLPLGSRHLFSATGQASYRHFFWNSNESNSGRRINGWQFGGTGGYQFSGERVSFAATYSIQRRQEGLAEFISRGDDVGLGDVDERIYRLQRTVGGQLEVEVTPRTSIQLTASRGEAGYEEGIDFLGSDLATTLDRVTYGYGAALSRRMTQRTTLTLFGDARRSDFNDPDSFRDNWRLRSGLRASFSAGTSTAQGGQPLTGLAEVGVARRTLDDNLREADPSDPLADTMRDDFTGVFGRANLTVRVHPRIALRAAADYRTSETSWFENTYFVNKGLGTGVEVAITRGLSIAGLVDYVRQSYPEPATVELEDGSLFAAEREDDLLILRARLRFPLFGQRLSIEGGHFDRDSNFGLAQTRGFFLRFGVGVGFGVSESI